MLFLENSTGIHILTCFCVPAQSSHFAGVLSVWQRVAYWLVLLEEYKTTATRWRGKPSSVAFRVTSPDRSSRPPEGEVQSLANSVLQAMELDQDLVYQRVSDVSSAKTCPISSASLKESKRRYWLHFESVHQNIRT